ncbi:MAG: M23 family metallopeptidase [Anaerotignum sp.]|nr:M23 family metallopeptidase [Anaerotignum sp.]
MKKNEEKKARRVQTAAICCCLCLLAVGAGVTYRAFDQSHLKQTEEEAAQPVTAAKTPTIEVAAMERDKQSRDAGEQPEVEKPRESKPTFAYPLQGEVLLPYSVDHAIYDPTLDQYRTNASISLAAKQGDTVKAAADGTVQEISADAESGMMVVIAHGENWLTTYGQLEETVKVKKGDTVTQGQAIGTVAAPTKYGSALGTHLEFAMEQNGTPQDPAKYLK